LVINAIDWIESFPAIHYDIGSVPSKNTGYKRNSLFPGLISDGWTGSRSDL